MFKGVTLERVLEVLRYEESGDLIWTAHRIKSKIGTSAGCSCTGGYKYIQIDGKNLPVHKLVYFINHGVVPKFVDHIDGNTTNNHIANLRAADYMQNNRNAKIRIDNKSGSKGVRKCSNGKWQVYVRVNGKQKSFGVYEELELADLVGVEVRNKYHGEFARHK